MGQDSVRGVNFNPPFFCAFELLAGTAVGVTGTLDRRDGAQCQGWR